MKKRIELEIKSFELGFENFGFTTWKDFLGEAAQQLDKEKIPLSKVTKLTINLDNIEVTLIEVYEIDWSKPVGQKLRNLLGDSSEMPFV